MKEILQNAEDMRLADGRAMFGAALDDLLPISTVPGSPCSLTPFLL